MRLSVLLLTGMAMLAADKPPEKKSAPASPKAAAAAPLTLPAGAVEVAPGSYAYTDAQGKKWLYRQTPFGLARLEDKPASNDAPQADVKRTEALVTAVEDGDSIRFTRPGPFGPYKWQRKKSELDDTEKAIWERTRAKSTSDTKGAQE